MYGIRCQDTGSFLHAEIRPHISCYIDKMHPSKFHLMLAVNPESPRTLLAVLQFQSFSLLLFSVTVKYFSIALKNHYRQISFTILLLGIQDNLQALFNKPQQEEANFHFLSSPWFNARHLKNSYNNWKCRVP